MILVPGLLVLEAFSDWWAHPQGRPDLPVLHCALSEDLGQLGAHPDKLKSVKEGLHFDDGHFFELNDEHGVKAEVFYFEWDCDSELGSADAFGHPAERCMGAAGMQVIQRFAPRSYDERGVRLQFDSILFQGRGGPMFVFKGNWVAGHDAVSCRPFIDPHGSPTLTTALMRIEAVGMRLHQQPTRLITCGVTGASSEDQAWQFMRQNFLSSLSITSH